MLAALLGFAGMFALMTLRVPIAFSMGVVGLVGIGLVRSWPAALAASTTEILDVAKYTLSVVPLFVLMGNFVTRAGMSRELYAAAYSFIGHRRGGLAMSTIAACAGFGAICGSSIATTATMARVAMPEMRRFNYRDSFAAGSIAAGGTLGILIPPSVIMVLYAIMTEQSIGALFAAGVLPGLLATGFYIAAAAIATARNPQLGPPGERSSWAQRLQAMRNIWGVLVLFGIVMGGMYGGWFTPTEAAGIGAMGGFLFALLVLAIGLLVILYAHYYLSPEDDASRFLSLLLLFMGSMLGVVLADNLLLLVVFWECTSLSSFLLIGFWRDRGEGRQGARMALTVRVCQPTEFAMRMRAWRLWGMGRRWMSRARTGCAATG